ncbi:4-hydroxy-tetrahydrodipicolinate synthase [soil metagenome]
MQNLTGTGVALVTPFNADLSVDFEGLGKVIDYTVAGGVDYLVVNGTTGESATLTLSEKRKILQFVKDQVAGRLPLVFGIGCNSTQEMLDACSQADLEGVAAVLSVSPYYNKPSQEGIYQHYLALANVSPVPVILYNVPGRTSSNVSADTTLRLARHPNIIGTKEASGNMEQCLQIARKKPKDFLLISGDDLLTLPMMAFGCEGVISVVANAFPDTFSQMVRLGREGNYPEAAEILYTFLDLNPLLYEESNPVGIKTVLDLKGICQDHVRLPLVPASDSLRERIAKQL